MNNIKLAWLAGIVEGEGCFSLASGGKTKNFFNVSISITNTDLILLKECSDIIKSMGIECYFKRRNKHIMGRKMRYDIVIQGFKKCHKFISILLPYMIGEKIVQAQLIKQFLERRLIIQKLEMKGSKAKYTKIDNAYLESFKYLKTFKTESVETKRSTSYEDEVIVRTACINKDAELGRNDLTINLN